ncbi:hypothetical protein [Paludisphaera rhizosphaerae]|uniref:hypothetical protein n=1 Tax=Paludisphaera rhizosphaerae TaxID=2711216 RepID=UPI0013EDB743|nr:hypothetical protein [Paludisphaera rhizosphaerae]
MTIPNAGLFRRGLLASIAGGLMFSGRATAHTPVFVRKNVKNFSKPEWRTLERGVAVMKRGGVVDQGGVVGQAPSEGDLGGLKRPRRAFAKNR